MSARRLSRSQQLFLRINKITGTNPRLDRFMKFCATWLVGALGALSGFWIVAASYSSPASIALFFNMTAFAVIPALGVHWALAFVWHHGRPHLEFPSSKQLVPVLQNMKSFPSDHATVAFIFVFMLAAWEADVVIVAIAGIAAALVALGRVYVGVHYPRDSIAGLVSALIFSVISWYVIWDFVAPWALGL